MKKCLNCGSYDVHDIEFRTDNAYAHTITPANCSITEEIGNDDLPIRISGYYCQSCQNLVGISEDSTSATLAENEFSADSLSDKKKFLVLIDELFVRDAQVLSNDYFINESDNSDDHDSAWKDWAGAIAVGVYTGCCMNNAIMEAADKEGINPEKLIAYEIIE